MWAQLMAWRVKPGRDLSGVREALQGAEQPDSGLLRTIIMRDQKDLEQYYTLVVFESEDRARTREGDPRREEGLTAVRELLAEILESPPQFHDLDVVEDWSP